MSKRIIVVAVALAVLGGCGPALPPSSSIVGDWSGRIAPLHFSYLMLRLRQEGGGIQGVACYIDFNNPAARGVLLDAVVRVNYPDVGLAVPPTAKNLAGFTFTGRFQADGRIIGHYDNGFTDYDMSFSRGDNFCGLQ